MLAGGTKKTPMISIPRKYRGARIAVPCAQCGAPVTRTPSLLAGHTRVFCSIACKRAAPSWHHLKRALPLLLLAPLLQAETCERISAELVVQGKGPGRFAPGSFETPEEPFCASEDLGINSAAGLKAHLWFTMPYGTLPPYTLSDQTFVDLTSATLLPYGAGWDTNATGPLWTFFITRPHSVPARGLVYWDYWFVSGGEWGSCTPGSTGRCYYLSISPGVAGGFYTVKSGWTVKATGQWCETRWLHRTLECIVPPNTLDPYFCWLPWDSTQPYPGEGG